MAIGVEAEAESEAVEKQPLPHPWLAGTFSQPGSLVRLSEISDSNQTCQPGRVIPYPDVQPGPTTRQTPFSGRGNVPLSGHTANKFRKPAVIS